MAKTTLKDKMLGVVFVGIFLLGFALVGWATDTSGDTVEVFWVSNDSREFLYNFTTPWGVYTTTGVEYKEVGSELTGIAAVPTYVGNYTWAMAVPSVSGSFDILNVKIAFDFDDVGSYLLKDFDYSLHVKPDIDKVRFLVLFLNDDGRGYMNYETNYVLIGETETGNAEWVNGTLSVSLYDALDIRQKAQNFDHAWLVISLADDEKDGLSSFSYEFSVQATGTPIERFSTEEKLTFVLFFAGSVGFLTALFMTDTVDVDKLIKMAKKGVRR